LLAKLLKLAARYGPSAIQAVEKVWPHIAGDTQSAEWVKKLLSGSMHRRKGRVQLLTETAKEAAAQAQTVAHKEQAEGWVLRAEALARTVPLLQLGDRSSRRQRRKHLDTQVDQLAADMIEGLAAWRALD
jgi:hypothetical protein